MGSRNTCKLEGREKYISQRLGDGTSKSEIARRLRVHRDTLAKFIEVHGIVKDDTPVIRI